MAGAFSVVHNDVHKWLFRKERAAQHNRTTFTQKQAVAVTVRGLMVSGDPQVSLTVVLAGPVRDGRCNLTAQENDEVC